jgi:hypothetical protein
MTPHTLSAVLFPIIFGLAILWLVLVKLLFTRLEKHHPQKYETMGRPSLFLRNNLSGCLAMLGFILSREHKTLGDNFLSKLSDVMLLIFVVYILLFAAYLFNAFGQTT